jgi:hypothetical protein
VKTIYVLIDPRGDMTKIHISSARNPRKRFSENFSFSGTQKLSSNSVEWFEDMKSVGVVPILREIETVSDSLMFARKRYWIKYYVEMGLDVVNDRAGHHVVSQSPMRIFHSNRGQRRVIEGNLFRAKQAGLPATLTFDQWISTLEHFSWKCAYCGVRDYTVLEHFIPIRHFGGTTQFNCVPACQGCNVRKEGLHPLFDPALCDREDIKQVYEFLKSMRIGMPV